MTSSQEPEQKGLGEMAQLMNTAADREHEWRFMVMAIGEPGSCAAEADVGPQVVLDDSVIHQRPSLAPILRAQLTSGTRQGAGGVITRTGRAARPDLPQ